MPQSTQQPTQRRKRIQTLAWIIWLAKLLSFLSVLTKNAPPEIKNPYLILRIADVGIGLLILAFLHRPQAYAQKLWRYALIYYTVVPFTIEAILTTRLQGGVLAWTPLVVGLGIFFLFDPLTEWKEGIIGIISGVLLSLGAVALHPFVGFLPWNPITENPFRVLLLIVAGGIGSYFVWLQYRDFLRKGAELVESQEALLAEQQDLTEKLSAEKAALNETLKTLEALRAQEQRRAQREATLSRYETLMRESYTRPVSDFLQKLLDTLAAELPMLGGLIYVRQAEGWKVESAYALRQYIGQTYRGGTVTTAASLKLPYLISPAPPGTAKIQTSVATLSPKAVLYLPFFSEATAETLAVAELLLSAPIESETEAVLQTLLPRIGTYLWARQSSIPAAV